MPFVILSSLTRRKHQSRYRHFELIETDRTCGVITSILKTFDQRTCEGIDGILRLREGETMVLAEGYFDDT